MEPKKIHSAEVKTCNYKAEKFWFIVKDATLWKIEKIYDSPQKCVCGTRIRFAVIIKNQYSQKRVAVGLHCAEKIGFGVKFDTPAEYLALAYVLASTPNAKQFVRSLQNNLTKFKRKMRVSKSQAEWLEMIVGIKWSWKMWGK